MKSSIAHVSAFQIVFALVPPAVVILTYLVLGYSGDELALTFAGRYEDTILPTGYAALWAGSIGLAVGTLWIIASWQWQKHLKSRLPKFLLVDTYKLRWLLTATCLGAAVVVTSWHQGYLHDAKAVEREAVRDTWTDYQYELLNAQWDWFTGYYKPSYTHRSDTSKIASTVTPESIQYFEQMKSNALSFDFGPEQVMALPPLQRMWLLSMRGIFSHNELISFAGSLAISGWVSRRGCEKNHEPAESVYFKLFSVNSVSSVVKSSCSCFGRS